MNVTLLQENFLRALTKTSRILSAKPQLPILQNALLMTEKGRLRVTTTNLETTESVWVGAKVEKEGGICVSAKLLTEFVMTIPPEAMRLSVSEGVLHITSSGTKATIPGVDASEFPPVAKEKQGKGAPIDKKTLLSALDMVIFSAASDEGRPLLTGVKFKKEGSKMLVVATDGYRLSLKKVELSLLDKVDLIIPARALGEVAKVGAEEKEGDKLTLGETEDGGLRFSTGDTDVITRTIDGEYPDFTKIIPGKWTTRVLFDTQTLVRAVKSAAIFARDSANIVKIHVENQSVTVSANAPSVGENSVEIEAKIDGDGGDIAFNSRFLVEFLTRFTGEELLFEMTGSLNPGVFRPVKDETYLHIIMPVRVTS